MAKSNNLNPVYLPGLTLALFLIQAGMAFEPHFLNQARMNGAKKSTCFKDSLFFEPTKNLHEFKTRNAKYNALIRANEFSISVKDHKHPLHIHFWGSHPKAKIRPLNKLQSVSHYYLRTDPKNWRIGVPNYGRVSVEEVYPGINMIYYNNSQEVEFDFIVSPGVDHQQIQLEVKSDHSFSIDQEGNLVFTLKEQQILLRSPYVYQEINGEFIQIKSRYRKTRHTNNRIGFEILAYDPNLALVIDPIVGYSTRVGGSQLDDSEDIAVDRLGNVFIAGRTQEIDFVSPEGEIPNLLGSGEGTNAFVTKLAPDGSTILYTTILGGRFLDHAMGIDVDDAGNAYIAGKTSFAEPEFPITENAFRSSPADFFISKLSPEGELLYSTYIGGRNISTFGGIDVQGNGENARVYLTGSTVNGFPTTENAYQRGVAGGGPFLAILEPSQPVPSDQLIYSTLFAGKRGIAIAAGPDGKAYLAGSTNSEDIPLKHGFDLDRGTGRESFLAIFDPSLEGKESLVYSTYIGGSQEENGSAGNGGIAVDSNGVALMTGTTASVDFPVTPEGYQVGQERGKAYFVAIDPNLPGADSLLYGTYFGGSTSTSGTDICAGAPGIAYITGYTQSRNILGSDGELAPKFGLGSLGSNQDSFFAKFDWTRVGSDSLIDAAYIGGTGADFPRAIASLEPDKIFITGRTSSQDYFSPIPGPGSSDAFITQIQTTIQLPDGTLDTRSSEPLEANFGTEPYTWTVSSGTLPPGLELNSSGVLSGIPRELGTSTFTVRVTDSVGALSERTYRKKITMGATPTDILIRKAGVNPIPGRILPYFILLRNRSDHTVHNVKVTEFLQGWFQFIDSSPPPTFLGPRPISNIYWTIPQLQPGELKVITYYVSLPAEFPLGIEVSGEACLDDEDCDRERAECLEEGKERCSDSSCGWFSPTGACLQCNTMEEEQCRQEWLTCKMQVGLGSSEDLEEGTSGGGCSEDRRRSSGAIDPNEKVTTSGPYIPPGEFIGYTIHFENIGNAEARDVFLTDVLDEDLDLNSVQVLRPYGGLVPLPPDTTVSIFSDEDQHWDVTLDSSSRTILWNLINIDLLPKATDSVFFIIQAPEDLPSGTEIRNESTIQFEVFEPLITNETLNTVDSTPPVALMDPLPEQTFTEEFEISWSGTDEVGEIELYAVFASVDDGPFQLIFQSTTPSSLSYKGEIGHSYGFLCVARDTAGNIELMDGSPETQTRVINRPISLFHRGDPNADQVSDISDSITIFSYLFLGDPEELDCLETADTNNDALLDITDGIYLLSWLFTGTEEPPAPGPPGFHPCGEDTDRFGTPGDWGCKSYPPCR